MRDCVVSRTEGNRVSMQTHAHIDMYIPNCCLFKSATLSNGGELLLTVVPKFNEREGRGW